MNNNGITTTLIPGQEKHEVFYSSVLKKNLVHYDYRHIDGELFSCVKRTLEICIQKRNQWINAKAIS